MSPPARLRRTTNPATSSSVFWSLTPAECRVVRHLTDGRTTQEIAAALHLSVHTVRTHLKHAMTKVGVHSQIALLARVHTPRR